MNRRRLLLWSDAPPRYGAGRQAALVADGLARRGHEVVVAQRELTADAFDGPHQLVPLAADDLWAGTRRGLDDRDEARTVLDVAAADVVLVNDSCPVANLALKHELVASRVPWIAVEHSTSNPPALDGPAWRDRGAALLSSAVDVIAVSHASLSELRRGFGVPAARGCVVANARPDEFFAPVTLDERRQSRDDLGVGPDEFLVLVMARVEEDKGTSVVLRAVELLASSPTWTDLRIRWAGEGTQRPRMTGVARLRGWIPQLELLGHRDDSRHLLAGADALLHISSREGMPLAVLEAMAMGVPVIASDIPAIVEATAGRALLVPDPAAGRDAAVAAVAAALSRAQTSPELRRELASAARSYAEANYRCDRAVDGYEEVLARVA